MKKLIVGLMLYVLAGIANAATLSELDGLTGTPGWDSLVGKIRVSLLIKAYDLTELASPTTDQLEYALKVLANPGGEARVVVFYVVAANSSASVSAILGASDSVINSNVSDAVDNLFAK